MELVLVDRRDDGVAVVTLNRPDKRNALSIDMRAQLATVYAELGEDEAVGAILLTGGGSAFCSGMDVTQFGGDRANREQIVETSTALFRSVALSPVPSVAFVNGPAVAGGFALALLCDLRIAAPDATFGFPELGRHIPPSYAAATAALPEPVARELCLTGRVVDARDAVSLGVASQTGILDDAISLAAQIAAAPRSATRAVRRRILIAGEQTWQRVLEEEERELREAVLKD
jgi:enoyl-CoA hydratase